jgi:hypothetical protein
MISNQHEYEMARQYVENLQTILLGLRQHHSPAEYAVMSKAYLKELARTQRTIVRFFAANELPEKV